jgi:hypothetical protein
MEGRFFIRVEPDTGPEHQQMDRRGTVQTLHADGVALPAAGKIAFCKKGLKPFGAGPVQKRPSLLSQPQGGNTVFVMPSQQLVRPKDGNGFSGPLGAARKQGQESNGKVSA